MLENNMPSFTQSTHKSNNWTYKLIIQLHVHFEQAGTLFFSDHIPNCSDNLWRVKMQ